MSLSRGDKNTNNAETLDYKRSNRKKGIDSLERRSEGLAHEADWSRILLMRET